MDILPHDVTVRSVARVEQTNLLHQRMVAEGLAVEAIARCEPGILRDLEVLCATCSNPGLCKRDLRDKSAGRDWEEYCLNAVLLNALSELWWFRASI